MYKYIKSSEDIYASSMSRILEHTKTNNIATLTAFITGDSGYRPTKKEKQTKKQNRQSNRNLSADLQTLLYGFTKISGYWDESGSGDRDNATLEETYLIIAPKGQSFDVFEKTMLSLAKKYEQQGVLIWSCEKQEAYLWTTIDYENYTCEMTFNNLNIDKGIEYAWSRYRKNSFVFSSEDVDNYEFFLESATELSKSGGGCSPSYGAMSFRKKLFEEYPTIYEK